MPSSDDCQVVVLLFIRFRTIKIVVLFREVYAKSGLLFRSLILCN